MHERPFDRWSAPRAIAIVALIVALVAAGCRAPDESVATASGPSATPNAIAEAERLLDEVMDGMQGTAAQKSAVFYLEHVAFQDLIIDCMARRGFTYLAPKAVRIPIPDVRIGDGVLDPVSPEAVAADGLGLDGPVDGFIAAAKAGDPVVSAAEDEDAPRVPEHEVPGWGNASSQCVPSESAINERVAHPSYARGAAATELVRSVLGRKEIADAMAEYPACMSAAGYRVDADRDGGPRRDLLWTVRDGFEGLIVDAEPSFSANATERARQVDELVASAGWRRMTETREAAAAADAECRRQAHDLAFAALLEPLRRFKAEHGAEIEQLRAEWEAFEQRADSTPDPGTL